MRPWRNSLLRNERSFRYNQQMEARTPGERNTAVLDSALRLFAERGYHGTAVPEIAHAAGVGTGTVYRHFDSKDDLVNKLYRRTKRRLIAHLMDEHPFEAPFAEQFARFWRRLADFARAEPHAFTFLELHHHLPYLDSESRALEAHFLAVVVEAITRAQKSAVLGASPPAALMAIVWGSFVALVRADRLGYLPLSEATVTETGALVWAAIATPTARTRRKS